MAYDDLPLTDNTTLRRLELAVEGNIAFVEYKLSNDLFFLIHTEVPSSLKGKGIGNIIVKKTLEYARNNKYKIVPICPFIQSYLKRHTEWNDIIAPNADRFIHKL